MNAELVADAVWVDSHWCIVVQWATFSLTGQLLSNLGSLHCRVHLKISIGKQGKGLYPSLDFFILNALMIVLLNFINSLPAEISGFIEWNM